MSLILVIYTEYKPLCPTEYVLPANTLPCRTAGAGGPYMGGQATADRGVLKWPQQEPGLVHSGVSRKG